MNNTPIQLSLIYQRPDVNCCQKAIGPKTFANILLSGPCNIKCNFCFGNDNSKEARSWNVLNTPANELININDFLARLKHDELKSVVITGTNTEPTIYKDLNSLILKIWSYGLEPSMITNGFLAIKKMELINQLKKVTYSLHTLQINTSLSLLGTKRMPNWQKIFFETKIPFKVNIVICEENKNEIHEILNFCKKYGVKRISLRDSLGYKTEKSYLGTPVKWYAGNPIYNIDEMQITAWNAELLETNSWNWLSNGCVYEQKRLYNVLTGKDTDKPDMLF